MLVGGDKEALPIVNLAQPPVVDGKESWIFRVAGQTLCRSGVRSHVEVPMEVWNFSLARLRLFQVGLDPNNCGDLGEVRADECPEVFVGSRGGEARLHLLYCVVHIFAVGQDGFKPRVGKGVRKCHDLASLRGLQGAGDGASVGFERVRDVGPTCSGSCGGASTASVSGNGDGVSSASGNEKTVSSAIWVPWGAVQYPARTQPA